MAAGTLTRQVRSPRGSGAGGIRTAFLVMVVLFSLNVVILTWHMGEKELFHSIKGRLRLLKYHLPWVKAVRETVTVSPEEKLQDVPPIVLRGIGANPVVNKEEAPKQDFVKQVNANSSPRLRGEEEPHKQKFQFVWSEATGSTSFAKTVNGDWTELHDEKPVFFFKEKLMSEEGGLRRVELFDEDRKFSILLLEHSSMLRNDHKEGSSYSLLYHGFWSVFNWKKEKHTDFGNYDDIKPPPVYMEGELKDQTIVVTISAYKDPLCSGTLFELFKYAEFPDRVSAIVIQQKNPEDLDCLEDYCALATERGETCRKNQVRIQTVDLNHARGVMPARYRQNLLLGDEEFCLQIDSHSAFENNWDTIALEDWSLTENEMAVITAYPNMVKNRHDQRHAPARCSTKWSTDGEVVHGGNSALNVKAGKTPYLIPFYGAGTAFSKCHANMNVPYDPYMSHLFGGEEFNRAIRLFTSGYDMYSPKRNFVYHYYDGDDIPQRGKKVRDRGFFNVAGNQRLVLGTQTVARWRYIVGLPLTGANPLISNLAMQDSKFFGLGTRRQIELYELFSGVDLKHKTAESRCELLGRMKWVPYKFSEPFYPSGVDCPYRLSKDILRYCCTTLRAVRDSTQKMLDVSNEEWATMVLQSGYYPKPEILSPILSPLNNMAKQGNCPEDNA